MKKILLSILLLNVNLAIAQNPVVTGTPAGYTVIDENVELFFDVTGANDRDGEPLSGKDLYIWAFTTSNAKTNTSFDNSSEASRLEKVTNNLYKLKFPIIDGDDTYNTLAEWFGQGATPGAIKTIGYLLKPKDASFQTNDLVIPFSPFKFDAAEVRTFPASATTKDIVTFRFNQNFTPLSNPALTGAQNISVHIEPSGNPTVAIELDTTFDGRYYQVGIIPALTFQALNNAGTLREVNFYFFDKDNPTITSAEGSIILKKAGN